MRIRLIVIFFVMLAQVSFFSKAEASDEDYHIKIMEALKRINIRLVRIETNKIASLKSVQASLLNQIMAIRTSVEQIQATGELNKSEMLASVQGMKTKILDIESHLRNEVMREFDRQNREDKQYRAQFFPLLVQLEKRLSDQNKALDNTHALLKADLIPALKNENDKTRQIFVAELTKLRR